MSRTERIAERLAAEGADALFAWSPNVVGYLANLWEHPHRRFATFAVNADGRSCAIVPALGRTSAEEAGIADIRVWTDDEDPLALFADLAEEWGLRTGIVAVEEDLPSRMLLAMQERLPAARFRGGDTVVAGVMRRKEPFEAQLLEEAARLTDEVWEEIRPRLAPGRTEIEIAQELQDLMRARGIRPTFAIVGGGPNSAKPHHAPGERPLAEGDVVLLDFGGTYERYGSDITRVVHLGPAPERVREAYRAVHAAHTAAATGIRAGATTGAEADTMARDSLKGAGLAEFFVHRLGHGLGLNEHEHPYLVGSNGATLEAGDCFTIEPGVYLPGEFGIRLENAYLLDEQGARSLNAEIPSEIVELS